MPEMGQSVIGLRVDCDRVACDRGDVRDACVERSSSRGDDDCYREGYDRRCDPDDRIVRLRRLLERVQRRHGAGRCGVDRHGAGWHGTGGDRRGGYVGDGWRDVGVDDDRLRRFLPTPWRALNESLGGGLPRGAVAEVYSAMDGGGGAMLLAVRAAAVAAASMRRTVVMVDTQGDFYPPAAWQQGIAPGRLLVIRAKQSAEAVWAIEQSLRCSAVAAVISPVRRLDDAASRRLQLAAEVGGGVGLLICSAAQRRRSFCAVQMLVEPMGLEVEGRNRDARNATLIGTHFAGCTGWKPVPQTPVGNRCHTSPVGNRCHTELGHTDFGHTDLEAGFNVQPMRRRCRITLWKVREGTPVEPFVVDLMHEAGRGDLFPLPGHRPAAFAHRRAIA